MKKIDRYPPEGSPFERQLIRRIQSDPAPPVPQSEIDAACRTAAAFHPKKRLAGQRDFWRIILACFGGETAFFWGLCALLLAGGCVLCRAAGPLPDALPAALASALAPCPLIALMIRELQARDTALAQLEKTCRYRPQHIAFARVWAAAIGWAALLFGVIPLAFSGQSGLLQACLCAFVALFAVGGVVLLLLPFLTSALPLSCLMAAWVLGALGLLSHQEVFGWVMALSQGIWAGAVCFSAGFFAAALVCSVKARYARA